MSLKFIIESLQLIIEVWIILLQINYISIIMKRERIRTMIIKTEI